MCWKLTTCIGCLKRSNIGVSEIGDPRGHARAALAFGRGFPEARTLLVGGQGIPLAEFLERDPAEWLARPRRADNGHGTAAGRDLQS
jgi:hypothetical protein